MVTTKTRLACLPFFFFFFFFGQNPTTALANSAKAASTLPLPLSGSTANGVPLSLDDLELRALTALNTVPLRRLPAPAPTLRRRRGTAYPNGLSGGGVEGSSTLLKATGSSFLASVSLGAETFDLVVDTGSSDTWVARADFACVDVLTGAPRPQASCRFARTFDTSSSTSSPGSEFTQVDNANFNITYGDGERVVGVFGTLDVTVAGVRAAKQQIALATLAAWQGDGRASGILGLAYPGLAARYAGTDPRVDVVCQPGMRAGSSSSSAAAEEGGDTEAAGRCNQSPYAPLITTLFFGQKAVAPVFGLALSRDESARGDGGYLSIGGVPDLQSVGVKRGARFASADVQVLRGDDRYRYYLIRVEGIVALSAGSEIPDEVEGGSAAGGGDSGEEEVEEEAGKGAWSARWNAMMADEEEVGGPVVNGTRAQQQGAGADANTDTNTDTNTNTGGILPTSANTAFVIDSGTTLSFFPSAVLRRYMSLFSPPGRFDPSTGFWFVDCSSTPPPLGVKIGGRVFWHNGRDLIKPFRWARNGRRRSCISGVQESGRLGGINILGDVFLGNVLAVFDLRGAESGAGVVQVDGDGAGAGAGVGYGGAIRFVARRDYKS